MNRVSNGFYLLIPILVNLRLTRGGGSFSNPNLGKIINKTGRSFNWQEQILLLLL